MHKGASIWSCNGNTTIVLAFDGNKGCFSEFDSFGCCYFGNRQDAFNRCQRLSERKY